MLLQKWADIGEPMIVEKSVNGATLECSERENKAIVVEGQLDTSCIRVVTLTAVYLLLYPFYLSPLRTLLGPPLGPNFLIGSFGDILNGEAGIPQREWVKKYGTAIRVVGPLGMERVIFSGAEALQKVLVADWISNPRPGFMRETLGLVTGHGLLTVTGDCHKQMRKAMNPAFSLHNLTAQTDMYYDAIDGLLEILNSRVGQSQVGQGSYEWITLDIICLTGLRYKADSLYNPRNELAEAYEELISLQTGRNLARFIAILSIPGMSSLLDSEFAWRHRSYVGFSSFFHPAKIISPYITHYTMHRIKTVSASILREKMKEAEYLESNEDTAAKKDIMSLLVLVPYAMSDTEMMDQVLTFLGAGHETTASGLAWTLWLLAKDPVSQQRLREEVTPYLEVTCLVYEYPPYWRLEDKADHHVFSQESLRLYPPVPMTFRQAGTTDYVDGVLVPKRTLYYIPIRVVNTLKDVWGEDAEFNPSRWLPESNFGAVPSTLTFLAGPHACIGKTMAIIEMKAVIAALIANFDFALL
ncbi:cytochrome P450 [Lentinula aciculospora]|uniref:Cytochrome P450 n=1 Tax=Lentinula aciculospora TaxID=153920 RepID=A0A9W9AC30_9AGAR|nr:cytochrome P450 [Lentinula aciculospora]